MTTMKEAAERLIKARVAFDLADQERKDKIRALNAEIDPIAAELAAAKAAALEVFEEPGDAKAVPGLGTVRMVTGMTKTKVVDQDAVVEWVAANLPTEIELAVRPATLSALLKQGGVTEDGECIPGLEQVASDPSLRVELEVK